MRSIYNNNSSMFIVYIAYPFRMGHKVVFPASSMQICKLTFGSIYQTHFNGLIESNILFCSSWREYFMKSITQFQRSPSLQTRSADHLIWLYCLHSDTSSWLGSCNECSFLLHSVRVAVLCLLNTKLVVFSSEFF